MMEKLKIFTRFNRASRKNEHKVYDRHDNVDRLSYVDNTVMVQRLINEGRSLAQARAAALRSGMYSGDLHEIDEESGIAVPIYETDPAIAQPIIEDMASRFATPDVSAKSNATINDASGAENSGVTAANQDSEDK